jgi:hypothetical protein
LTGWKKCPLSLRKILSILSKTNQELAEIIMEINHLRRIATLSREKAHKAQKAQKSGPGFAPGSVGLSLTTDHETLMSKNRRLGASRFPYYHAFTAMQGIY